MFEKTKKLAKTVIAEIFVDKFSCVICDAELPQPAVDGLCDKCREGMHFVEDKLCLRCGVACRDLAKYCLTCQNNKRAFDIARSAVTYEDNAKILEYGLKFGAKKYIAKYMATLMSQKYTKEGFFADIIVPVPLSAARFVMRGYNQAEVIAQELATILLLPIGLDVVYKIKDTVAQAKQSAAERRKNVQDAYKLVNADAIRGKSVLVVDDVMTTGATIEEVCKEIRKGKPKSLLVLTFASATKKL